MKTIEQFIEENTRRQNVEDNNALYCSLELKKSRQEVSGLLNELVASGKLVRIKGKPILYAHADVLRALYSGIIPTEFASLAEYHDWRRNIDSRDAFSRLIGVDGSLSLVAENVKSAISYPPKGLTTIFTGETGTGKSFLASLAFEYGQEIGRFKKDARFIQVNCSEFANNPELLTANLFGYKKGAFTGADADNPGLLQAANGGVLFLDEVHSLQPECQEKMFLYLDSGHYRMLGDNQTLLESNAMILFATTEVPEKVLLKTLLRRIPVRIKLPSLRDHEVRDKYALLLAALEHESEVIGREIQVTASAWNALISYDYPANVGDLNNIIQITCMNALFRNPDAGPVQIHTLMLPGSVLTSSAASRLPSRAGELLDFNEIRSRLESSDHRVALLRQVIQSASSTDDVEERLEYGRTLLRQFTHAQWGKLFNRSLADQHVLEEMLSIVSRVFMKYGYSSELSVKEELCWLLYYGLVSPAEVESKVLVSYEADHRFCQFIEQTLKKESSIAEEIITEITTALDLSKNSMIQSLFALSFSQLSLVDNNQNRAALIICHGQSTASSMANAVNTLLGENVFDGIDMPLDMSTHKIVDAVNTYLLRKHVYRDLVLLVDMGSLEQLYESIRFNSTASVALANHVNTEMALIVGSRLQAGEGLKEIFEDYKQFSRNAVKILDRSQKQMAIVCSCSTGLDTAEKLQQILQDSLPANCQIAVLAYDYLALLQEGLESSFFDRYQVLAIAGTLDPKLDVPFLPLEQLINQEAFPVLKDVLGGVLTAEQLESTSRTIIKNFSLNNVISNLTILNPVKLLDQIEEAVNRLGAEYHTLFRSNVCLGLYVHLACLTERLVTRQDINDYEQDPAEASQEAQIFYCKLKKAFSTLEAFYRIEIPFEESEYIRMYLSSLIEGWQP